MPAAPDDPLEREVRTLARKLKVARGFCFVVYFVDDRRASRQIEAQLAALLGSRHRRLVVLAAEAPGDLVRTTLDGIFGAAESAREAGSRPVVWVEAFRDNGNAEWDAQRRLLLMRMNERRSRFEAELAAPLILLLPAGGQRDAASLAPDLWHVRLHSAQLSVARTLASAAEGPTRRTRHEPEASMPSTVVADGLPAEVAYWNSVHEAARVAAQHDPQALAALSLQDGFDAVHGWLRAGRTDRAVALAEQLVAIARGRFESAPQDDAVPRHELAIALREWGDSLVSAGELDLAVRTLQDGVSLARGTDASAGRDPGQDRVLSTLLFSVGDALMRAGRAREAESRFQESLALVRSLPATAEAGNAKAVGLLLGRIGDAARAADDAHAALEAYRESVLLWRHLRESSGDDPALLRSLGRALTRLGDAEWDDGQGERAMTAYAEGLALLQEAISRVGATEETQREVALMLLRIGQAEQAVGRFEAALSAYDRVWTLCQHLRRTGAPTAELLTDLAEPLQRVVDAARGEAPPSSTDIDAAAQLLAQVLAARAAAPE